MKSGVNNKYTHMIKAGRQLKRSLVFDTPIELSLPRLVSYLIMCFLFPFLIYRKLFHHRCQVWVYLRGHPLYTSSGAGGVLLHLLGYVFRC